MARPEVDARRRSRTWKIGGFPMLASACSYVAPTGTTEAEGALCGSSGTHP
jgi:hypothetical protein